MEGLVAAIFVIIGIVNFVQKQQQEQNKSQGGMKKQQSIGGQRPPQQRKYTVQQPRKVAPVAKADLEEGFGNPFEYVPEQAASIFESEGMEVEDRRRAGSMDYKEEVQSQEGTCDEHPEHDEKKLVSKAAVIETEEKLIFDLTEENLLRSMIMAEVIGPPRSMKRNIR